MGQGSPTSFQRKHAPDVIRGRKSCLDRRKARSYSQPPRHCHSPAWPEGDGERVERPPKHHRSGPIRAAGHDSDIAEASKAPVCRAGGRQTRPWNQKSAPTRDAFRQLMTMTEIRAFCPHSTPSSAIVEKKERGPAPPAPHQAPISAGSREPRQSGPLHMAGRLVYYRKNYISSASRAAKWGGDHAEICHGKPPCRKVYPRGERGVDPVF